jgi:hypothetical protein
MLVREVTGIGWRVKLGAVLILAAGAAAAMLGLLAGGSSDAAPGAMGRRALAARQAQRLIAAVRLPGGPDAAPASGGAPRSALAGLHPAPGPDTVQRVGGWDIPASAGAVRAFLEAHPPRGTRHAGRGPLTFVAAGSPPGVTSPRLELTVVPDGPHMSTVRAEARVHWLVPRSPSERVPSGARELVITRGPLGRAPSLVIRLTARAPIARIRALLDRLPPAQPGRMYHCPAQFPQVPVVRFVFLAGRASMAPEGGADGSQPRVLALASEQADVRAPTTVCDAMRLTVAGRPRTPLLGGHRLLRQVSALLGRRLWTRPYAA